MNENKEIKENENDHSLLEMIVIIIFLYIFAQKFRKIHFLLL